MRDQPGVRQDFVHLGLCLLRHHGIAARYVSGYRGQAYATPNASVTMTRIERVEPASISRS